MKPKTDYTLSTKTKGGMHVKGLFLDGKFIRGYMKTSHSWIPYTWFAKSGACIYPGTGNFGLEEPVVPFGSNFPKFGYL